MQQNIDRDHTERCAQSKDALKYRSDPDVLERVKK